MSYDLKKIYINKLEDWKESIVLKPKMQLENLLNVKHPEESLKLRLAPTIKEEKHAKIFEQKINSLLKPKFKWSNKMEQLKQEVSKLQCDSESDKKVNEMIPIKKKPS